MVPEGTGSFGSIHSPPWTLISAFMVDRCVFFCFVIGQVVVAVSLSCFVVVVVVVVVVVAACCCLSWHYYYPNMYYSTLQPPRWYCCWSVWVQVRAVVARWPSGLRWSRVYFHRL